MVAEITYNAGKSYRIKATKFLQHKTEVVTDPDVIKRCQMTAGFAVRIVQPERKKKAALKKTAPAAKKTVREVVPETEEQPKKRGGSK